MTRDEVQVRWDELTPRERDAWVAEAVMGWTPRECGWIFDTPDGSVRVIGNGAMCWDPTRRIAAAWQVVEKIQEGKHNSFRLFRCDSFPESRRCAVSFKPSVESALKLVEAPTAPEAICLAALMAVLA